ncbi:MAG: hypothetical protein GX111_09040, partial [Clostridiales bacterium]|nr:hypothetical protein [Clostridiales bacterium]
ELEALYEAGRIENITDCGGNIASIAVTYGQDAIKTALEKSIPESEDPYYAIISASGDGETEFASTDALTVRTGQKLIIEKDIILKILSDGSLLVEENGVMDVYGTLTTEGSAVNSGYIVKGIGGIINGTITNQENGKYYTEREINDQAEWTEVLNDPTCFYAEVNGDITISGNVDVGFSLLINKDASVDVSEGSEFSISPFADTFISYSNVNILGTLINNGTITINPGAGIEVFEGATLSNNGLIDVYGWLNANYDSLGGAVKFYANLADVARCLWNALGGLLPKNVDEDADYVTFADALADMANDDVLGRYALTWLLKNDILDETDLHPYDYAEGAIIGDLLEAFADAADKSYTASITGGVCVSDASDESGSTLDKLIKSFVDALDVSSANAGTESDLRKYLALNYINEIHITDNISLSDNLTVTKHVLIDPGKTLTAADGKNLTVEWRENTPEQAGCAGVLVVDGTLVIPSDSVVINKGEIDLSGTITNNGIFTNMIDEPEHKYESLFFGEGGTLDNNGTFVANGYMALSGTDLKNRGTRFTNNGSFVITGGTVTSSAPFHNAGYMKICDLYGNGGVNTITALTFNGTLTNNSNWIEYTAAVYSADGFAAAQSAQDAKKLALGDSMPATGLECYNRMDIMNNIDLSGNHTVSGWDIWVEAEKQWNDALQEDDYIPYKLTITAASSLTVKESTINVNGKLINNGTLILGQDEKNGGLQVWPRGTFTNTGTVSDTYGYAWRMDEYQYHNEGPAELLEPLYEGTVEGYEGAQDIAIVHDWKALKDAAEAKFDIYERIDILGNDCDITLEDNLTVSADMYVEWDDGIEIPEGLTLTLSGSHWLDNSGDIWVYGTLNIGSGFTVNNMSYIQVDGTVFNHSVINNMSNITLIGQGTIQGTGAVVGMPGSSLTGNVGVGTYYRAAENEEQLIEALGSGDPILITGDVTLSGDLPLTGIVTVGLENVRNGAVRTGAHTLTIENGAVFAVDCGELEIGEEGAIVNNGSLTIGEYSGLRILADGTLTTQSDVYVNGWHDFYDWDNQDLYLLGSGKVHCFASERDLVHFLYCCLYETDNGGPPITKIYDILASAESFDDGTKLEAIGNAISGFDQLEFDTSGQYAYAALSVNGNIIGDSIVPHAKLTYANAKALMNAVANKLGADISAFWVNVPDSDSLSFIRCNNASEEHGSDFDQFCKEFHDALTS